MVASRGCSGFRLLVEKNDVFCHCDDGHENILLRSEDIRTTYTVTTESCHSCLWDYGSETPKTGAGGRAITAPKSALEVP